MASEILASLTSGHNCMAVLLRDDLQLATCLQTQYEEARR